MVRAVFSGENPGIINLIIKGVKTAKMPQIKISKIKKEFKTLLTNSKAC